MCTDPQSVSSGLRVRPLVVSGRTAAIVRHRLDAFQDAFRKIRRSFRHADIVASSIHVRCIVSHPSTQDRLRASFSILPSATMFSFTHISVNVHRRHQCQNSLVSILVSLFLSLVKYTYK